MDAPQALADLQPVRRIPADSPDDPQDIAGLCLSGGGYRAMLFHVGALKRLNDAGRLPGLARISSVSGGSITAAALALHWGDLDWQDGIAANFDALVMEPIRALAQHTIDVFAVAEGMLPFVSVGERVAHAYREHLFGDATLQQLPAEPAPLFVLNATNLESGALFRFTRPFAADWRVGTIAAPQIALADAVAASSAFPPVLSPFELDLTGAQWTTETGNDLATPGYRGKIALSDGGVYDNLGLETVWKRCRSVLVSDGGGHMPDDTDPPHVWPLQTLRVLKVIDNQVRDLRKRQTVASFRLNLRTGAYWGIRSHVADYQLADPLDFPAAEGQRLAALPTRLAKLGDHDQRQLVNWGYVICDAALRRWLAPESARPGKLPY
jgi:NTE family protein